MGITILSQGGMTMSWCPKCDSEYIESFTRCKKCDVDLIEKEEETVVEEYHFEDGVFLVHANNEIEADIFESFLSPEGIRVVRKHREAGAYLCIYMGTSNFGVDLYVPKHQQSLAKEILESRPMELEIGIESEDEWQKEKYKVKKKRRNLIIALLLVFYVSGVIVYLVDLFYY
jgi:hypothetical protein